MHDVTVTIYKPQFSLAVSPVTGALFVSVHAATSERPQSPKPVVQH